MSKRQAKDSKNFEILRRVINNSVFSFREMESRFSKTNHLIKKMEQCKNSLAGICIPSKHAKIIKAI